MAFCTKCGNKLRDDDRFCTKCGATIERPSETSWEESAFAEAEGHEASAFDDGREVATPVTTRAARGTRANATPFETHESNMGDGHDLYEVHALDEAFANKCPACGEPLQPKDKMCPACGYEVAKLRARVAAKKRGDAERASTSSESSHDVGEQAKGAAGRKRATAKRAKDAPKTPWDDAERTAREADGSTKRETSDGADNVPSEAKPDKKNSDIFLCLLVVLVGLALLPVLASGSLGLMSLGTWGFLILIIVLLTKNKNKS